MEANPGNRRVGLVLSGGAARGFAHIGTMKVMERAGIRPDVIAGTSIGAILGALYAAGHSADDLHSLARETSWRDVIDLSLQLGLIKGEKLHAFLSAHLPATFEELELPLAISTTDMETGEQVYLTEGDLIRAIRASSSFPGAFEPVQYAGRTLADGGIINNLPVDGAAFLGATYIVASDVTPPRRAAFMGNGGGTWWERVVATVRLERRNPMAHMIFRSSDIMQRILTDIHYNLHPADVRVQHGMPHIHIESFLMFEEIVELGERAAEEAFRTMGLLDDGGRPTPAGLDALEATKEPRHREWKPQARR